MRGSFRKFLIILFICTGLGALAQIPGTFPFAFLRSSSETCEAGSQSFGVGASTNNTDGVYNFAVPTGCKKITVKAWGAGGAASCFSNTYPDPNGGSGGFTQATVPVSPGQGLKVVVGSGGRGDWSSSGHNVGTFGGPSVNSTVTLGGGYSGIHATSGALTQANALVIAGGGGGPGTNSATLHGGGGGGWRGEDGLGGTTDVGSGGGPTGSSALALKGEDPNSGVSGGGGGGYFGGGKGTGWGGGGGGSAFVVTNASKFFSVAASGRTVALNSDIDYVSPAGLAGVGVNAAWNIACAGQNGRVVLKWGPEDPPEAITINSNVTINSTNFSTYFSKAVTIATGVTVTADTSVLYLESLTMQGTAKIVLTAGKPLDLVIGTNLSMDPNSVIDADGKGYASAKTYGNASASNTAGGSHGGHGGSYGIPSTVFGSIERPETMGGGGAGTGGGVIRLRVGGVLSLNGLIKANGLSGGAGGSIWITATTISSSSSVVNISASGGTTTTNGGGGGGRIAIYYGSLGGFAVTPSRVQAYGAIGRTGGNADGGPGTIFSKMNGDTYGDLLIAGPTISSLTTKIGVFGQVQSISTTTLNTNSSYYLLPATDESLMGKTLRPDVTQAATISLVSNTANSLTASATLVGLTAASKFFYVTDYETVFKNVKIVSAARVDTGYLKVHGTLEVQDTALLSAYDVDANNIGLSGSGVLQPLSLNVSGELLLNNTAKVTSFPATATALYGLNINSANVTINSGASIDVSGKGYPAGKTYGFASGGASSTGGSHGGYGGQHGSSVPNEVYGSLESPETAGAGGYGTGMGGGILRLQVSNTLTLNGLISANGTNGTSAGDGGGAGGSIWIVVGALESSSSGVNISANGGVGAGASQSGGGGGGRIAIYYNSLNGFEVTSSRVRAYGGSGALANHAGGAGTIFYKQVSDTYGSVLIASTSSSTYKNTRIGIFGQVSTISSATLTSSAEYPVAPGLGSSTALAGKTLKPDITQMGTIALVSNTNTTLTAVSTIASMTTVNKLYYVIDYESRFKNFVVAGGAKINLGYLAVENDLEIRDFAVLQPFTVVIGGHLQIKDTAKITTNDPSTSVTYGLDIAAQNMTIASGGSIDLTGKGYLFGRTIGNAAFSSSGVGGSHAGYGGKQSSTAPTEIYGNLEQPETPGSGGYGSGNGGGVIRLNVSSTLTLNGLITADGLNGTGTSHGGGAGGSIWITAGTIESSVSTLNISASGGAGTANPSNGGGGGRIAIYYGSFNGFVMDSTRVRAYGGNGFSTQHAGPGTIFSKSSSEAFGDLLISNPYIPSYKNTRIGVFGQISSLSGSYIYSTADYPLLPGYGGTSFLAGKILKPDVTKTATATVSTNSSNSLMATTSVASLSAVSKYFYVTNYETQFRNVKIVGAARLDVGYLKIAGTLEVQDTANLNSFDVDVTGDVTFSGSTIAQLLTLTTSANLVLNDTSKITSFDSTAATLDSVNITANAATIAIGAMIDMNGKGYMPTRTYGNTTTGASANSGGSHGGYGGRRSTYIPNNIYGSLERPETAGSGGAGATGGGFGGGIIKLTVTNTLTLNGVIRANGVLLANPGTNDGGGAGGSIWITAGTIESIATGLNISASGGSANGNYYAGGGGGRIAIYYGTLVGFNIDSSRVQAYGGTNTVAPEVNGGAGTIYSKSASASYGDLLVASPGYSSYLNTKIGVFGQVGSVSTATLTIAGSINLLPGLGASTLLAGKILKPDISQPATRTLISNTNNSVTASSSLTSLTANNKYFYLTDYETQFRSIKISGAARLDAGYLNASEDLEVLNTAVLNVYDIETKNTTTVSGTSLSVLQKSIATGDVTMTDTTLSIPQWNVIGNATLNGASVLRTESVDVGGTLALNGTSKLIPYDPTTTAVYGITVTAGALAIASGASIDVNAKGYLPGRGYGNVTTNATGAGGSHGGYGGRNGTYTPNEVFGSMEFPTTAGAGGYLNGYGGGIVRLNVASTLTLDGLITANGGPGTGNSGEGGGAGGSVWITAGAIASTGSALAITANGGVGSGNNANAGGGGRIAIYYGALNGFTIDTTRVRAYGGLGFAAGNNGGTGTIFSKKDTETFGDLLISGPTFATYKNTKVGVFGQVNSISTATLNAVAASQNLLPGSGATTLLANKILKPDITQSATRVLVSSTNAAVIAASSLSGLTAASKYFYVMDYESQFKNVKIGGTAKADFGYLQVSEDLDVQNTALLTAYDIETKNMNVGAGSVSVLQKYQASGTTVFNGSTFEALGSFANGGSVTASGASVLSGPQWTVAGNATLNDTSSLKSETINVGGTFTLNNTSKLITYDPTTISIYGIDITAQAMSIAGGASIDVNSKGYLPGRGYGNATTGASSSGGSHGGYGGRHSTYSPNEVYGTLETPTTAGAGGYSNGYGGGVIRLNVVSTLALDGLITANGGQGTGNSGEGGGAGGSIWITAGMISSTSSAVAISASGGIGSGSNASGGGGGRVAIYYNSLSGFAIDSSRVRAYGGTGFSATHAGGAGTIYAKQNAETYGDLLISGSTNSSYKNTKIGVFGQVQSVSTTTLTPTAATQNLLPGYGSTSALAGKILKPDITQPATLAVASSTNTSLVAVSSLAGMTASPKMFYILDYETTFKSVKIAGSAKLNVGYLNVQGELTLEDAASLSAYDIQAGDVIATGSNIQLSRNLTVDNGLTFNTASLTMYGEFDIGSGMSFTSSSFSANDGIGYGDVTGDISIVNSTMICRKLTIDGNISATGSSTVTLPELTAMGNVQMSNTGTLNLRAATISGDLALLDSAKVVGPASSALALQTLQLATGNLSLASGTSISVDGKGYYPGYTFGNVTTGAASNSGGSHGGYGGRVSTYVPNEVFGDFLFPVTAGAGGAGTGYGGGVMRLTVNSALTLNGVISANGTAGTGSTHGGGAGGSIWITAGSITSSSSGVNVTANGGAGTGANAGGGGGGRIAIYYDSLSGFAIDATRVQALGGTAGSTAQGGAGTIYSSNASNGQNTLLISGAGRASSYGRTKLTLAAPLALELFKIEDSAQVRQANNTQALTINTLEIKTSGALEVPTNGAADYGSWFQYSNLVGGPAPTEY